MTSYMPIHATAKEQRRRRRGGWPSAALELADERMTRLILYGPQARRSGAVQRVDPHEPHVFGR